MSHLYSLNGYLYALAPNGRTLVKAGKRNYRESTEWTGDDGRKWIFNEKTRRWGLHPDHKKLKTKGKSKKSKADTELKTLSDAIQETSDRFDETLVQSEQLLEDILGISDEDLKIPEMTDVSIDDLSPSGSNNIVGFDSPKRKFQQQIKRGKDAVVPFKKGDRSAYSKLLSQWNNDVSKLAREAEKAVKRHQDNEDMKEFLETMREVQAETEEFGKQVHQERIENLERAFKGRIDRLEARVAAGNKRLFEVINPGKAIRVPKGTTQREYADIARKIFEGDKDAIARYTVDKPKAKAEPKAELKPKSKQKKGELKPKKKAKSQTNKAQPAPQKQEKQASIKNNALTTTAEKLKAGFDGLRQGESPTEVFSPGGGVIDDMSASELSALSGALIGAMMGDLEHQALPSSGGMEGALGVVFNSATKKIKAGFDQSDQPSTVLDPDSSTLNSLTTGEAILLLRVANNERVFRSSELTGAGNEARTERALTTAGIALKSAVNSRKNLSNALSSELGKLTDDQVTVLERSIINALTFEDLPQAPMPQDSAKQKAVLNSAANKLKTALDVDQFEIMDVLSIGGGAFGEMTIPEIMSVFKLVNNEQSKRAGGS